MASQHVGTRSSEPEPVQLVPPPSRARIDPAYDIQDDRVLDIVAEHPEVATLLDEIATRTPEYFPEASGLVIRSQTDPEDGSLSWYVEILTPATVDQLVDQLHRFDHEWWLAAGAKIEPEIIFTVAVL
jgi:hypothetical protein